MDIRSWVRGTRATTTTQPRGVHIGTSYLSVAMASHIFEVDSSLDRITSGSRHVPNVRSHMTQLLPPFRGLVSLARLATPSPHSGVSFLQVAMPQGNALGHAGV
jgi:hypothetical protein